MRRCPQCFRNYHDDSLKFCLDDGEALVDGPADAADTAETAILPSSAYPDEAATRRFNDGEPTTKESSNSFLARKSPAKTVAAILVIAVVAIAGVGAYFYLNRNSSVTKQISSIAVMPFVNASGDPDIDYLSDGVTESLINSLSKVPTVSVKARSSVFTYKGKEVTPQQVAHDLSVQAVLNGRIVRLGDQIQMNVELVDAGSGNQIWGEQYTRKFSDLLQLQSEIAREVSANLKSTLTGDDNERIGKSYTANTEAYQLYLRGRYYWNKRKPGDINKSAEYFQQAIDKDPNYALAYSGLAEAYILLPQYLSGNSNEYYPKARAAAEKAIELDPTLAEAHNALGAILSNHDWKFAEAEAEFKRTLELNPNYATGRQWYAEFLKSMGRFPDALAEMKRAEDLDPLSLIIKGLVGMLLRVNGQNEAALEQLNKTLDMDPNFPRTHLFLAELYQSMGRYDEAADEFSTSFKLNGLPPDKADQFAVVVKNAYKTGGPAGYFSQVATILESRNTSPPPPVVVTASYWVKAGNKDHAFELLNKAFAEHDDDLINLKDGRLRDVESDPRYKDLLRRIGLPE